MSLCRGVALAVALAMLPMGAYGQTPGLERHYTGKSETDLNVGIFSTIRKNCTAGPLPVLRLVVPPAHGKVTVRQGKLHARNFRQCLATDLPALIAIYRSAPNFVGQDIFTLEVTGANGKSQMQRITVTIVSSGKQQGI